LNLDVEQAAQAINNLKTKVKTSLHISIRISLQLQNSKELQEQIRPNQAQLKLKNDLVTQWNSTLHICQRMCEVQEPLNATTAVLMNPVECRTTEE